jgi:hypothetical protein
MQYFFNHIKNEVTTMLLGQSVNQLPAVIFDRYPKEEKNDYQFQAPRT